MVRGLKSGLSKKSISINRKGRKGKMLIPIAIGTQKAEIMRFSFAHFATS
jgi:hypothetical protein